MQKKRLSGWAFQKLRKKKTITIMNQERYTLHTTNQN